MVGGQSVQCRRCDYYRFYLEKNKQTTNKTETILCIPTLLNITITHSNRTQIMESFGLCFHHPHWKDPHWIEIIQLSWLTTYIWKDNASYDSSGVNYLVQSTCWYIHQHIHMYIWNVFLLELYFCTSFLKMVEIAVGRLSNSICTLVPKVHIELFKSPLLLWVCMELIAI